MCESRDKYVYVTYDMHGTQCACVPECTLIILLRKHVRIHNSYDCAYKCER